ncbi:hypothetical protein NL108_009809, partial [Boleophthalmus pectinirostris]
KKSLREQWLMDGLQSEEEREAMKIQAQDELERTTQLQSNILRMEKEMEELEEQELELSAKEENILKRLKEVERTTEDIIKTNGQTERANQDLESALRCVASHNPTSWSSHLPWVEYAHNSLTSSATATFAMEISVEVDKRTGKTQVISSTSITPDMIQEKGLKVYEDGRKSVYALPPGGCSGEVSELTPTDVDELLRQATDWSGDVQYHQPVYAAPFSGTSRPSTPRAFKKDMTPALGRLKGLPIITQPIHKNLETSHELDVTKRSTNLHGNFQTERNDFSQSKTPSPAPCFREVGSNQILAQDIMMKQDTDNQKAAVVLIRASSDGMPNQLVYKNIEMNPPSPQKYDLDTNESDFDRNSPTYTESLANSLLEELDPGAVTMVFMGYENVDEDDEEPIQAELVVIGNSDEEDMNDEDSLSIYHPYGYTSKVFQP